jgi:hypothetical protein
MDPDPDPVVVYVDLFFLFLHACGPVEAEVAGEEDAAARPATCSGHAATAPRVGGGNAARNLYVHTFTYICDCTFPSL